MGADRSNRRLLVLAAVFLPVYAIPFSAPAVFLALRESLLPAGPSLSLPSILVISGELGWAKTAVYIGLVVALSDAAGLAYGAIVGG